MSGKLTAVIAVLILLIIFVMQNYEPVRIKFLMWSFGGSSAVMVFISLMIGFLVGLLVRKK